MTLEELIYRFLLQADYPRSSIVFKIDLLNPAVEVSGSAYVPTYIIVDPGTAEPLAVIEVVDAVGDEDLAIVSRNVCDYAARIAKESIQKFVIRVDVRGRTEAEQIQFYRIYSNNNLEKLSGNNFPDLETLKVHRKLIRNSATPVVTKSPRLSAGAGIQESLGQDQRSPPGAGLYLPALVLVLLFVLDGLISLLRGEPLLSIPQSVLALGAAVLLTLPAAIRYFRQ